MHRDYTRSLPSVHSLSGFAGLEEYNHDTYITGSLADTHLFAGHGRPGHLPSGGAEYWREISSTSTGAAVRAALRAGVGCDLPVDHVTISECDGISVYQVTHDLRWRKVKSLSKRMLAMSWIDHTMKSHTPDSKTDILIVWLKLRII